MGHRRRGDGNGEDDDRKVDGLNDFGPRGH